MGIICGKSPTLENQESKRIDKYLRDENVNYKSEIKLLLLGAGESGKSTIAKQMQILHKSGFSQQERIEYIPTITYNILDSLMVLILKRDINRFALFPVTQKLADEFVSKFKNKEISNITTITKEDAEKIQLLWNDPVIKSVCLQDAAKLQLFSSAQYFLDSLHRVLQSDYIPSDQDILHARRPTTGIHIISFTVDNVPFKCVDVGGQRSERRKWLHDVAAILFCVALDEYNMRLMEDSSVWRVHESLKLFGEIANSSHLANAGMILFLNKRDLFQEKIKNVDLTEVFPNYTGGKNYDNAVICIFIYQKQFLKEAKNPDRAYVHVTVATDTENIQFVFNAVKDRLIHQMLDISGV